MSGAAQLAALGCGAMALGGLVLMLDSLNVARDGAKGEGQTFVAIGFVLLLIGGIGGLL